MTNSTPSRKHSLSSEGFVVKQYDGAFGLKSQSKNKL